MIVGDSMSVARGKLRALRTRVSGQRKGGSDMSVTMVQRDVDDLRRERRELLDGVGMSGKALRQAAREDSLSAEEWAAFERLREIHFLLHAERPKP
jgi:hypothetical protein